MKKERKDQVIITYEGKTQNLSQWCKELDLNYSTIYYRFKRGISAKDLFKETKIPIIYKGEEITIKEIQKIYGIKKTTFYYRIRAGWSIDEAIETAVDKIPESKITEENKKYGPKSAFVENFYKSGSIYRY